MNLNFDNFKKTIDSLSIAFNKSTILDYISQNSFEIINQNVSNIKNSLETIVAVFEEIRATSQNTAKNTSNINSQMGEIVEKNKNLDQSISQRVDEIGVSNEKAKNVKKIFEDIIKMSGNMSSFTSRIQQVSKKTNILAINASIEASKAGAKGLGFSIIANEVRKLATQTNHFANEIDKTIKPFINELNKGREYINEFTKVLENVLEDIKIMKNSFKDNTNTANEVGQALSMINDSVNEETLALNEGLNKLENIFEVTRNAYTVSSSIRKVYGELDKILNQKA